MIMIVLPISCNTNFRICTKNKQTVEKVSDKWLWKKKWTYGRGYVLKK